MSAFRRRCDGSLEHVGTYPAGGPGLPFSSHFFAPDNPLGSQHAAAVVEDQLFVANAGSPGSVAQFRIF